MAIIAREIWKPVVGYEGLYEVSDWGRVRSLTRQYTSKNFNKLMIGQRLKDGPNRFGYVTVTLYKNKTRRHVRIHRLVALAFMPNPLRLPEVNHLDGDKTNNSYENLVWCTSSENKYHAFDTGLKVPVIGSQHGHAKLNEQDVFEIKILLSKFIYSHQFIANIYKISRQGISNIHAKKTWTHVKLK